MCCVVLRCCVHALTHACGVRVWMMVRPCGSRCFAVQKVAAAAQALETAREVSQCRQLVALITDLARALNEVPLL